MGTASHHRGIEAPAQAGFRSFQCCRQKSEQEQGHLQGQQGLVQEVAALQEGQAGIGQVAVAQLADVLGLG